MLEHILVVVALTRVVERGESSIPESFVQSLVLLLEPGDGEAIVGARGLELEDGFIVVVEFLAQLFCSGIGFTTQGV